jgi:hypothetical protein
MITTTTTNINTVGVIDAEIDRPVGSTDAKVHDVLDAVVAGSEEPLGAPAGVGQESREGPQGEDLGPVVRRQRLGRRRCGGGVGGVGRGGGRTPVCRRRRPRS